MSRIGKRLPLELSPDYVTFAERMRRGNLLGEVKKEKKPIKKTVGRPRNNTKGTVNERLLEVRRSRRVVGVDARTNWSLDLRVVRSSVKSAFMLVCDALVASRSHKHFILHHAFGLNTIRGMRYNINNGQKVFSKASEDVMKRFVLVYNEEKGLEDE